MRRLIAMLLVLGAPAVWAEVGVVREFQPAPGRSAEMLQTAAQARAIHEKLGASIFIGTDQLGHVHYVQTFADWAAWAKFAAAAEQSKEWTEFFQKVTADPPSTLVNTLYLDMPLVAKTTPVTIVYGWEVTPGMGNAFMALVREAAAIHAKLGASPGISVDDLGNVWYETAFDSWAAWAKFDAALNKDADWAAFIDKASETGTGVLTRVLRIQQVPQ